jgi:hypothetical protein
VGFDVVCIPVSDVPYTMDSIQHNIGNGSTIVTKLWCQIFRLYTFVTMIDLVVHGVYENFSVQVI